MTKQSNFDHVSDTVRSLVQENIAWGVAVRMINNIMFAANRAHSAGVELVNEDKLNTSPYKKGDQIHQALVKAVTLLDAAELDGVDRQLIEDQLTEQLERQFQVDGRRIQRRNFEKQAFDILFASDDEFAKRSMRVDISEDDRIFCAGRVKEKIADLKEKALAQQIAFRDARNEYRDLAERFMDDVLNPRSGRSLTSSGDYAEYIESREAAFNSRIKALRGEATMVDGKWVNRYDFNGELDAVAANELDTYIVAIIDEGIRLKYEMPEYPRSVKDADAAYQKLHAVS